MWRGFVSRRTGLWKQALDSMQRALELNPRVYVNWVELGLTYLYLHQYDQAREAFAAAAAISPGHPWINEGLSRLALQESGDTDQAMRLTDGAQNSGDATFVTGFINARLYGGRLEETLEAVRNLPDAVEVQRQVITLREDWAAQILHFLGRETEARNAANAALFRLQGLRARLGDDFRLDLAEARLQAILGEDSEAVKALVLKAAASQPEDTVDGIRVKLDIARIYAIAGLAAEAVDLLDSLLQPPSETSLITVRLDPAFDGIRGEEQFLELMERWQ